MHLPGAIPLRGRRQAFRILLTFPIHEARPSSIPPPPRPPSSSISHSLHHRRKSSSEPYGRGAGGASRQKASLLLPSARNAISGIATSSGNRSDSSLYAPKFSATARCESSSSRLGDSKSRRSSSNEISPRSNAASCKRERQIPFRTFNRSATHSPLGKMCDATSNSRTFNCVTPHLQTFSFMFYFHLSFSIGRRLPTLTPSFGRTSSSRPSSVPNNACK
jgi:hypothetical protein